jgi:hypothetical protein
LRKRKKKEQYTTNRPYRVRRKKWSLVPRDDLDGMRSRDDQSIPLSALWDPGFNIFVAIDLVNLMKIV